jgi:5-methyltetrahydropteroyltriglutamate--homocysteine methyltransferase
MGADRRAHPRPRPAAAWRNAFENSYWQLNQVGVPLLLATYFSPLEENLSLACRLPVAGLHVDGVRATARTGQRRRLAAGAQGAVGRHRRRPQHLAHRPGRGAGVLAPSGQARGGKLWLSSSCSLLHVPFTWRPKRARPGNEIMAGLRH